jgi:hypothetical protein
MLVQHVRHFLSQVLYQTVQMVFNENKKAKTRGLGKPRALKQRSNRQTPLHRDQKNREVEALV